MSRIVGVSLLFIILLGSLCQSTAKPPGFHLSKKHIYKCRCRSLSPNGMKKCRSPFIPTNLKEKRELVKCLCSKIHQTKFPEFQKLCSSWHPAFPITFV